MRTQGSQSLDDQFISRVFRTSVWVTVLGSLLCWSQWGWRAGAGLAAGSALFLACLGAIQWGVYRFVRLDASDGKPLLLFLFGMYGPLILAIWFVVHSGWFNLPAFAAGVALPIGVMVLKAIGQMLLGDGPAKGKS